MKLSELKKLTPKELGTMIGNKEFKTIRKTAEKIGDSPNWDYAYDWYFEYYYNGSRIHWLDWMRITKGFNPDITDEIWKQITETERYTDTELKKLKNSNDFFEAEKFEDTMDYGFELYDFDFRFVAMRINDGEISSKFDWRNITYNYNPNIIDLIIKAIYDNSLQIDTLHSISMKYDVDKHLTNTTDLTDFFESYENLLVTNGKVEHIDTLKLWTLDYKKFLNKPESRQTEEPTTSPQPTTSPTQKPTADHLTTIDPFYTEKNEDQLSLMFRKLQENSYISKHNNVDDWLIACGKKENDGSFKKIEWIEKCTKLADFINQLFKKNNTDMWKKTQNLFIWKEGKPIKDGHMSSYKQKIKADTLLNKIIKGE